MQWSEAIDEYIRALTPIKESLPPNKIFQLLDLTSLNKDDTESSLREFCQKAHHPYLGQVAAICVYPQFVRFVANEFANTAIKVATVVNFPEGRLALDAVLIEIERSLQHGANEIDVVFPYMRYLAGERQYAETFVAACKAACGEEVVLKVILETGALQEIAIIADAAFDALQAGADFIKTSTGKIGQGATLDAAATLLLVIKHLGMPKGLKVSGGIRNIQQAQQYIELAHRIMGPNWVTPLNFRIGASRLAEELYSINYPI